jgi:hypothetical protein
VGRETTNSFGVFVGAVPAGYRTTYAETVQQVKSNIYEGLMTKDEVSNRRDELKKAKEALEQQTLQAQDQINAFEGAIQDCNYWLQALRNIEISEKAATLPLPGMRPEQPANPPPPEPVPQGDGAAN